MNYIITEKPQSYVIYIDADKITTLCNIADRIEDFFPASVLEVTHNRIARQGSIIIAKSCFENIDEIKKICYE